MSELQLRPSENARPLVAVVCAVPLLGEAMESTLDFAEVRSFSGRGGDVGGLLQWLRPDAVVVDDHDCAVSAAEYAVDRAIPVLHVCVRRGKLRLFRAGAWADVADKDGPTPEVIRNVLAGALFAREGAQ